MSSQPTNKQSWSIRPTVQCDNTSCLYWHNDPEPGMKCLKCHSILPTWVGYLYNNSDGDIIEESNYPEPHPIERSATLERESWYADEVDDEPLKLIRTDGYTKHEEEEECITNGRTSS